MKILNSTLLIFLGLFLLISGSIYLNLKQKTASSTTKTKECLNCNVLLIDIDMLRADALPCYGYFRNTAPNICNFAKNSALFKDNYSAAEWTLPSSFSTITSLYPALHQVNQMTGDVLDPNIPTLAETLQKAGYQTVLAISWKNVAFINSDNGGTRGYDLISDQNIDDLIKRLSKSSKPWFIHYYLGTLHLPYLLSETTQPIENLTPPQGFPTTEKEYQVLLNKYLKKHYLEVFQTETLKKYAQIIFAPSRPNDTNLADIFGQLAQSPDKPKYLQAEWLQKFNTYMGAFDQNNPNEVAYVRMLYDTKIKVLDSEMNSLFKLLVEPELAQKTVTILMSDHGESFGEHGLFSHDPDHHSELFFTPLIINSPQFSNRIVSQTSSNMDIFPTILSLVNLEKIPNLKGINLAPFINQPNYFSNRLVVSENLNNEFILQNRNWLYYLDPKASTASQAGLYNKILDPKETVNVIDKYPDLAEALFKQVDSLRSEKKTMTEKPKKQKNLNLSQEQIDRMKKEGYF